MSFFSWKRRYYDERAHCIQLQGRINVMRETLRALEEQLDSMKRSEQAARELIALMWSSFR